MIYVNKNADLTEAQRKIVEVALNSSWSGHVTHVSRQKSVRRLAAKGYCTARHSSRCGVDYTITVAMTVTEELRFGKYVDVAPTQSSQALAGSVSSAEGVL